jgi:hypothetical protein
MNYFTPELYQQINSFDVNEAEHADEAWDRAENAYKECLASIREHMPSPVVKLSALCLHDALVLARVVQAQPDGPYSVPVPYLWTAVAIVSVATAEEAVSLIYSLSDHTTTRDAPEGWRFSKLQEQWLYDEVDLINGDKGPFIHRILLSSGVTLEIPFVSVIIHQFTLPAAPNAAKQSA